MTVDRQTLNRNPRAWRAGGPFYFTIGNDTASTMATTNDEMEMPPTSDDEDARNLVSLLYLEVIRKDDYQQWKRDPQLVRHPLTTKHTVDDTMSTGHAADSR